MSFSAKLNYENIDFEVIRAIYQLTVPTKPLLSHHLVAIRGALSTVESIGLEPSACLKETGLTLDMLNDWSISEAVTNASLPDISLAQEFQFYRNVLSLSSDPLIGLKLGRTFRYESYGLLGYAMLSAQNLRETIGIASDFSVLTFSHFSIKLLDTDEESGIAFQLDYDLAPDLLQHYCDRDLEAAFNGVRASGLGFGEDVKVKLMHSDYVNLDRYQSFFDCEVELGHHRNEILVERSVLNQNSSQPDRMASEYCQAQCKKLLNKFGLQGGLVEQVQKVLVARPGTFPNIEETAKRLNTSVRTLRRNLNKEGKSFQGLLDEIRLQLAKEYLSSTMSIERIAELLGYSEAANFSHAFKRWTGLSPSQQRRLIKNNIIS